MRHTKKINSRFYEDIVVGAKTFEIRKEDDCIFETGDTIELVEIDNVDVIQNSRHTGVIDVPTGRSMIVEVTYRLEQSWFPQGLKEGYVILGIKPTKSNESKSLKRGNGHE